MPIIQNAFQAHLFDWTALVGRKCTTQRIFGPVGDSNVIVNSKFERCGDNAVISLRATQPKLNSWEPTVNLMRVELSVDGIPSGEWSGNHELLVNNDRHCDVTLTHFESPWRGKDAVLRWSCNVRDHLSRGKSTIDGKRMRLNDWTRFVTNDEAVTPESSIGRLGNTHALIECCFKRCGHNAVVGFQVTQRISSIESSHKVYLTRVELFVDDTVAADWSGTQELIIDDARSWKLTLRSTTGPLWQGKAAFIRYYFVLKEPQLQCDENKRD